MTLQTLPEWLSFIEQQHPQPMALGLERLREVATRMQLERPAAKVITVAGTNGKGSTTAFIQAIANAANWKVGSYTSPHLLRYNERVQIGGQPVTDEQLIAGFKAVEAARGDTALTYFEFGPLAALWLFQQAKLDLAVLEVGLGGRLDAVNLIDADVAVITTVDIDHTEWLGKDRETIGAEKAGIARGWKPLILGEVDPPSSVLRHAYAIGAQAIRVGSDYFYEKTSATHWHWRDVGTELELPFPALVAPAQMTNAATAIAALRALRQSLPREAYATGVANARMPGRLQRFEHNGVELVLDVGHNPQAITDLSVWLKAEPTPSGRTLALYASLADKDAPGVVNAIGMQVSEWYLAGLESVRGQTAAELHQRLQNTQASDAKEFTTVAQALCQLQQDAKVGDRILVFGSFHTVAEALTALPEYGWQKKI